MANKSKQFSPAINSDLRKQFATGDPEIDTLRLTENPNRVEVQPTVLKKFNEKVIENRHNASIVLGRDYTYDELNDTSIGMIDIACGRTANVDILGNPIIDGEVVENPKSVADFDLDAARIYLSQKANIDKQFNLPRGTSGDADIRSAVGIKADAVRIISRDANSGIKLVVEGKNNSQGGDGGTPGAGVELIAGDGTGLQPMVKADELATTLLQLSSFVLSLEAMLMSTVETQQAFNSKVATEMAVSPFFAAPSLPDFTNLPQLGKTTLDQFCFATMAGKSLAVSIQTFQKLQLGVHRDSITKKVTQVLQPKFASKHHKLD